MLNKKSVVDSAIRFVMLNTTYWVEIDDVRDKFYYLDCLNHELEGEGLFWKGDRAYGTLENICGYLFDIGEFHKEAKEILEKDPDLEELPSSLIQEVVICNFDINTVDVMDLRDIEHEPLLDWLGIDRDALVELFNIPGWGGGRIRRYRVTPYELAVFNRVRSQTGDKNMYALVMLYVLDRSSANCYLHSDIMNEIHRHISWYFDELAFNISELWDAEF